MIKLENFYSSGGIFTNKTNDNLYDGVKGKVILKDNAKITEKKVALNIIARLAYESTAITVNNIEFSSTLENIGENNIIVLIDKEKVNQDETVIEVNNNNLYFISKNEETLVKTEQYIYGRMPYIWDIGKSFRKLNDVICSFKIKDNSDVHISKIVISSKYQGLKKVHLTINTTETEDYINEIKKANVLKEFNKIEEVILKINKKEVILQNYNFIKEEYSQCIFKNILRNKDDFDLTDIFSVNKIYSDNDDDFLPDSMDYKICIPENADNSLTISASNIVSRLALDCLEVKLPLIYSESEINVNENNVFLINKTNNSNSSNLIIKNNTIILQGKGENLVKFSENIAKKYPYIDNDSVYTLQQLKDNFSEMLNYKNSAGQLVYLDKLMKNTTNKKDIKLFLNDTESINKEILKNNIKDTYKVENIEISNYKSEEKVWTKNVEFDWEVDVFNNILRNKLYPLVKEGDIVSVTGYVSEEFKIRKAIKDKIYSDFKKIGAEVKNCNIYCAYKQGFSWITEKVIPNIKKNINLNEIEKVKIKFKPFLPEGTIVWSDEDGATPNLNAEREDNENKWFDLPIRFLQELYPIDDILAKELNINRDKIVFEDDTNISKTYEIECITCHNEVFLKDWFDVKSSERPYLNEYPKIGKVHPSTGWLEAYINDEKVIDIRIKTDLENIWDFYQREVLSEVKEYILSKNNGQVTSDMQPFFKELRLEIEVSEPDYKLDSRMDIISSLDALHEDIYFVGLDFFKTFGMRVSNELINEPGLVLPVIKKCEGKKPKIKAILTKEKFNEPTIIINNDVINFNQNKAKEIKINRIMKVGNEYTLCFETDNEDVFESLVQYSNLLKNGIINYPVDNCIFNIRFNLYKNDEVHKSIDIKRKIKNIENSKIRIDESKVNTEGLIGYRDYMKIMEYLKNVKGLKTYVGSKSYQGRDVYAIEMIDYDANDIVSRYKLINYKPVYLINNRHHANEVSSTNAAFDLVKLLLNDDKYKRYLNKLNIIIVPFENVDGGALHYELQKDNPEWKLHVARYNSVGKEFSHEYFNFNTKYTEALTFTKLWYKWLPDIIVDNHGIPSHEWDQQFSGYVSPWFKGFWLPRALYYGYFWYINSEKYSSNKEVIKELENSVAIWLNEDEEISKWNEDWKDRFEKYANKWMPKLFPVDYYKNMIFYWIECKPNKKSRYASHRYPDITCLDWTTEASDETAHGNYLKLCSKAHVKSCLATMEYMSTLNIEPDILDWEENNTIILKKIRKRPLENKIN